MANNHRLNFPPEFEREEKHFKIVDMMLKHHPQTSMADIQKLIEGLNFAQESHEYAGDFGKLQIRYDTRPYFKHVEKVAQAAAMRGLDWRGILSHAFHDLLEKGYRVIKPNGGKKRLVRITYSYLKNNWGEDIAEDVAAMSVAKFDGKKFIYPQNILYYKKYEKSFEFDPVLYEKLELDQQMRIFARGFIPMHGKLEDTHDNLKSITRLPDTKLGFVYLKYKSRYIFFEHVIHNMDRIPDLNEFERTKLKQSISEMQKQFRSVRRKLEERKKLTHEHLHEKWVEFYNPYPEKKLPAI